MYLKVLIEVNFVLTIEIWPLHFDCFTKVLQHHDPLYVFLYCVLCPFWSAVSTGIFLFADEITRPPARGRDFTTLNLVG